jgi:hypothetical protein
MLNITLKAEVIGKPEPRSWNMNGQQGTSYRLNIAQNDGTDMASLRCHQKVYDTVARGDECDFLCQYNDNGENSTFRIVEIVKYHKMKDNPSLGQQSGK